MENAVDLAKYLLSNQKEFTSEEIDKILNKGTTRRIYMDQKANVHIFSVQPGGKMAKQNSLMIFMIMMKPPIRS